MNHMELIMTPKSQSTKKIHTPHDALFKAMTGNLDVSIDLLRSALPAELFSKINLSLCRFEWVMQKSKYRLHGIFCPLSRKATACTHLSNLLNWQGFLIPSSLAEEGTRNYDAKVFYFLGLPTQNDIEPFF